MLSSSLSDHSAQGNVMSARNSPQSPPPPQKQPVPLFDVELLFVGKKAEELGLLL